MHARAATRNVLSLALAATFLAAQLLSFSHLLLVQHVTCPEHGELIHIEEAPPVGVQDLSVAQTAVPEVRRAAVAAGHDHEHCLLIASRRNAVVGQPPEQVPAVGSVALLIAGVPRSPSETSVELLLLAPKSSPPA